VAPPSINQVGRRHHRGLDIREAILAPAQRLVGRRSQHRDAAGEAFARHGIMQRTGIQQHVDRAGPRRPFPGWLPSGHRRTARTRDRGSTIESGSPCPWITYPPSPAPARQAAHSSCTIAQLLNIPHGLS